MHICFVSKTYLYYDRGQMCLGVGSPVSVCVLVFSLAYVFSSDHFQYEFLPAPTVRPYERNETYANVE